LPEVEVVCIKSGNPTNITEKTLFEVESEFEVANAKMLKFCFEKCEVLDELKML
jgi:hypothetical protein